MTNKDWLMAVAPPSADPHPDLEANYWDDTRLVGQVRAALGD